MTKQQNAGGTCHRRFMLAQKHLAYQRAFVGLTEQLVRQEQGQPRCERAQHQAQNAIYQPSLRIVVHEVLPIIQRINRAAAHQR